MPAFSGNMALFAINKAGWARFIGLVVFDAFIRLTAVLMSAYTI